MPDDNPDDPKVHVITLHDRVKASLKQLTIRKDAPQVPKPYRLIQTEPRS